MMLPNHQRAACVVQADHGKQTGCGCDYGLHAASGFSVLISGIVAAIDKTIGFQTLHQASASLAISDICFSVKSRHSETGWY